MLYLFDIDAFDIWTFDVVFALLFMRKYFIINIYKHQKVAILLIITLSTLLLIISTFFPYSESPNEEDNLNSYQTIKKLTGSYLYCFIISYNTNVYKKRKHHNNMNKKYFFFFIIY